jgi:hypothetical protein
MKRKYFFVILFLVLAIFFIINASSVNAKMYKILDSEGNVICLTNNPVLSIEEKEAGCTISPPPEENIDVIQGLVTTSGSDKYDFRETNWGMSKEQVKEIENSILFIGEDSFQDSIIGCDGSLHYNGEVNGLKCDIYYYFIENRLVSATYKKVDSIVRFKAKFISNYKSLKSYLRKKYGKPYDDGIEMIKNEPIAPYAMVIWENPTDSTYQILLLLMGFEDRNKVEWLINYQSREGKNIKECLADYTEKEKARKDYTEKEKARKEAEALLESQIKELESQAKELKNKPKAEIKLVDSNNRLKRNYYYVEGILKNNGKGTAFYVKVEVRALDKYGKLVSIDYGYAKPSTIAPGQEATYQIMVEYDSEIDEFDKSVSWRND